MRLVVCNPIPIIEPIPIKDEYASRVARIEELDGAARFVFVSEQTCYEAGNTPLWVVCQKIIMPWTAIPFGVELTQSMLSQRATAIAGKRSPRLVGE